MKVTLLMCMTADGKIAKHAAHLANWTSHEDKQFFVAKTKAAGVIIMGLNTFKTFPKALPDRLNVVLHLPTDTPPAPPADNVEFTSMPPAQLLASLTERGYTEAILGGGSTINGLFLTQGLIDEIYLTVEPKLFGSGLDVFSHADVDIDLELLEVNKLSNQTLQLHYRVKKS